MYLVLLLTQYDFSIVRFPGSPKFCNIREPPVSCFVSLPRKLDILYYHISCCKNQAYRCLCIFVYNHQKMCVTILYIWCQEFVYRLCSSVYNILKKKVKNHKWCVQGFGNCLQQVFDSSTMDLSKIFILPKLSIHKLFDLSKIWQLVIHTCNQIKIRVQMCTTKFLILGVTWFFPYFDLSSMRFSFI